jgi:hypothetical protein
MGTELAVIISLVGSCDALGLDYILARFSETGDDSMIQDITADTVTGLPFSPSGFGHPICGFGEEEVIPSLPGDYPICLIIEAKLNMAHQFYPYLLFIQMSQWLI